MEEAHAKVVYICAEMIHAGMLFSLKIFSKKLSLKLVPVDKHPGDAEM